MDSDGFDVDAWLDGYKPRVEYAEIYGRGDLVGEITRLEGELAIVAESGDTDDDGHIDRARDLVEEITRAKADLEASKRTFSFAGVGHDRWYELMLAHPATEQEQKDRPNAAVGAEFQVHAVAEASREPKLTVEQCRRMRSMRADDFERLWLAVVTATEGMVVPPKSGIATAVSQLFEQGSTNRKARRSRGASGRAANGARSRNTSTTKKAG